MILIGFMCLRQRFGSGDGERKTLLTRQIAFEPLPASVLFGLGFCVARRHWNRKLVMDSGGTSVKTMQMNQKLSGAQK